MQARLDQQRRYAQQREQQNQMDYHLNQVQTVLLLLINLICFLCPLSDSVRSINCSNGFLPTASS